MRSRPRSGLGSDSESEDDGEEEEEREEERRGEGGDGGDTHAAPLLRFVQVGALPKGAAVEFQVSATAAGSERGGRLALASSTAPAVEGVWSPTLGYCFAQVLIPNGDILIFIG
jgi:hypothetical protein